MRDLWLRPMAPLRDVDGDTLDAMIDQGFRRYEVARFRLARVNTPELTAADPLTREEANQAADFTTAWFGLHLPHNPIALSWPIVPMAMVARRTLLPSIEVAYFLVQSTSEDVFGRWLAEVTCQEGHNLSSDLLTAGLAVVWVRSMEKP